MKLNIQGNVLRVRLMKKEVSELHNQGLIESAIHFSSGRALRFRLISSPEVSEVSAVFLDDCIRILTPLAVATAWAESTGVAIESPGDSDLKVLIEKDFKCLHRSEQRDPDAYPNPSAAIEV